MVLSHFFRRLCALVCAGLGAAVLAQGATPAREQVHGLPLVRSYPLEEIGNATRAASLGFDAFGRVALISDGAVSVLNDTAWIEVSEPRSSGNASVSVIAADESGVQYYGGLGGWGELRLFPDGRMAPIPLVPADAPSWVRNTNFNQIVRHAGHHFFVSWNGIVQRDIATGTLRYHEISAVTSAFVVRGQMMVCSLQRGLQTIDLASGRISKIEGLSLPQQVVHAASLSDGRALLALGDGVLLVFDGTTLAPWPGLQRLGIQGTITALLRLPEGRIGISITGRGLFLFSEEGELFSALTVPQYHRVVALAAHEPGVLWVMSEDAVEKVLYGSPITVFGQRLGLPISWPLLAAWRGHVVVSSEGRLYEAVSREAASPSRFELMRSQLPHGAWGMTSQGSVLLVGNNDGVASVAPDGTITTVVRGLAVSYLQLTPSGLCYVVGKKEVGVLRCVDGVWRECAPRVPNVGSPQVVVLAGEALWMEYGADRVGRLELREGVLNLREFRHPQWSGVAWVNIGTVGSTVVLSAAPAGRLYFDERTQAFRDAPELEELFARSPHNIVRVQADASGTVWASHRHGVVMFVPKGDKYEMDSSTYDNLNDLYPRVQVLDGDDVWISGPRSLYHVEQRSAVSVPRKAPLLVAVMDGREGEARPAASWPVLRQSYPYGQKDLILTFFTGTYAWLRIPRLRYRLNGDREWSDLPAGSPLNLTGLREGTHRVEVQLPDVGGAASQSTVLAFDILPPWYRTRSAYAGYGLGIVFFVAGLVWWTGASARRRNQSLERQVRQRTSELEETMRKLNEETRTAATLAERNRLAGEIHDSLQQGLCGAILQLDATISHPASQGPLRERLSTVRNMVSYTRHEVQSAVWDLESPILAGGDFGGALRKLVALINPGSVIVEVAETGTPATLTQAVQHHLLRVMQEAATNAVKHAKATRIDITLAYAPGQVSLVVADDGVGFLPAVVMRGSAANFGVRGIQARARKIGGTLSVDSSPGKGTRITLTVPLEPGETLTAHEAPTT